LLRGGQREKKKEPHTTSVGKIPWGGMGGKVQLRGPVLVGESVTRRLKEGRRGENRKSWGGGKGGVEGRPATGFEVAGLRIGEKNGGRPEKNQQRRTWPMRALANTFPSRPLDLEKSGGDNNYPDFACSESPQATGPKSKNGGEEVGGGTEPRDINQKDRGHQSVHQIKRDHAIVTKLEEKHLE